MRRDRLLPAGLATIAVVIACASAASPAHALNPVKPLCGVAGWVSGIAGKACGILQNSHRLITAGENLLAGKPGAAAKALFTSGASGAARVAGLAAVGAWVAIGARAALKGAAAAIDSTTKPQLNTTWFSSTYWRMAGIAAVLTLPFLFAAAIQALMRSDLALLLRAAFGYLPLALLAVSIAAPVAMLLLAASDQMSAVLSSAAKGDGARALDVIGGGAGLISSIFGSPFLAFLVGLLLAAGALALWLELLIREAAVYVVVLMLPLAFAAMVWPARRIWAVRVVELLVALILAKFAIVAVLALAATALGHTILAGPNSMLIGLALVTLAALAPWALVRLLPMAEVAGAAAGPLRREMGTARTKASEARKIAEGAGMRGEIADHSGWEDDHSAPNVRPPDKAAAQEGAHAEHSKLDDLRRRGQLGSTGAAPGSAAEDARSDPAADSDGGGVHSDAGDEASAEEQQPPFDEEKAVAARLPRMPALYQRDDQNWRSITLRQAAGAPAHSLDPLDPPDAEVEPPETEPASWVDPSEEEGPGAVDPPDADLEAGSSEEPPRS